MKRFAAILLAGILSVSAVMPAFAAVQTNAANWAVSSMEYAYEKGIITEAELQKAKSPMSRKEFCGVVMGFLESVTGIERKAENPTPFQDCNDPVVVAAYEAGVIGGIEPGVFAPDQTLTREQMAIMIARTLKVCNLDLTEKAKKNPFTDTTTLYESSNRYIDQLYGTEIVSGYTDNTYGPFNQMTVQEAVVTFVRAHRYIMTEVPEEPKAETPAEMPEEPKVEPPAEVPEEPKAEPPAEMPEEPKAETPAEVPEEPKAEPPAEMPEEPKVETPAEVPEKPKEEISVEVPEEPKAEPPAEVSEEPKSEISVDTEDTEMVKVDGKPITLGWSETELKTVWGEPDRKEISVYGLNRYVYINDYVDYFFVTFQGGRIVEIFVPGRDYAYMGMNGKGTMADIRNLTFVSMAEHSGVVRNEDSEARLLMDYEGHLCGLLLQTKEFVSDKDPLSTLVNSTKQAVEAQLLDLIQVCRVERGYVPLVWDRKLFEVARAHSEDMVSEGYFDYNSPDGTTPFGRIMERSKEFFTASEIIARQRGDVVNVYQEWMRTPARVSGLTDHTMQEVGIGVASKMKVLHVTVDMCGHAVEKTKK